LRPLKTGLPSKNFFATLYTEFSDRSALAPNLAKILLAAERKGGKISVRDAQLVFSQKFRPSAQMARSWFSELVILGYGSVKKFGKSWIFENTPRSDDQMDQLPSNPMLASIPSSDLPRSDDDQLPENNPSSDPSDHQLIHEVITFKPLQGEEFRSIVVSDPLFATSEKFPTDEDVKKDNFENYIEGILLNILKFIQQQGGKITTRDLC
jgi:hypothetical protein